MAAPTARQVEILDLVTRPGLTDRQLEALRLLLLAGSLKRAAHIGGVSRSAIAARLGAARCRAGVSTTLQLVAWADDRLPGWRADGAA